MFRSSSNLAAAYGIAVTLDMLITTILTFFVIRYGWKYPLWLCVAATGFFFLVDLAFFTSNLLKLLQGGWFPLLIGGFMFTLMMTWKQGRTILNERSCATTPSTCKSFLESRVRQPADARPRHRGVPDAEPGTVPNAMLHNLKHNKVLHEHNLFVTVRNHEVPWIGLDKRVEIETLGHDCWQVTLHYGFKNDPDVPRALEQIRNRGCELDPMTTSYFLSRDIVVPTIGTGMAAWREKLFAPDAPQRQRGGRLPEPAQQLGRGAGQQGRDLVQEFDVVVVGAGLSGVAAAPLPAARVPDRSYVILEGRDAIGGTWDLFRYPGVRSDSDMFTLGYTFRPWTSDASIADGAAIRDYIRETAREEGVLPHPLRPPGHGGALGLRPRALDGGSRCRRRSTALQLPLPVLLQRLLRLRARPPTRVAGARRLRRPHRPSAALAPGHGLRRQAHRGDRQRRHRRHADPRAGGPGRARHHAAALAQLHHRAAGPRRRGRGLQRLLPRKLAYRLIRWKNILLATAVPARSAGRRPCSASWSEQARKRSGVDVKHLQPRYDPWDQRLCIAPDADLFRVALRQGVDRHGPDRALHSQGLRLASARTAGGHHRHGDRPALQMLGGARLTVDGRAMGVAENAVVQGDDAQRRAQLRHGHGLHQCLVDAQELIARQVPASSSTCATASSMSACRCRKAMPARPGRSTSVRATSSAPWASCRGRASRKPWRVHQNYLRDLRVPAARRCAGGALRFGAPGNPCAADALPRHPAAHRAGRASRLRRVHLAGRAQAGVGLSADRPLDRSRRRAPALPRPGSGPAHRAGARTCRRIAQLHYLPLRTSRSAGAWFWWTVPAPGIRRARHGKAPSPRRRASSRLRALRFERPPLLVGHSLGGAIALSVAAGPGVHRGAGPDRPGHPFPAGGAAAVPRDGDPQPVAAALVRPHLGGAAGHPQQPRRPGHAVRPPAAPRDFGVRGGGLRSLLPSSFCGASTDMAAVEQDLVRSKAATASCACRCASSTAMATGCWTGTSRARDCGTRCRRRTCG